MKKVAPYLARIFAILKQSSMQLSCLGGELGKQFMDWMEKVEKSYDTNNISAVLETLHVMVFCAFISVPYFPYCTFVNVAFFCLSGVAEYWFLGGVPGYESNNHRTRTSSSQLPQPTQQVSSRARTWACMGCHVVIACRTHSIVDLTIFWRLKAQAPFLVTGGRDSSSGWDVEFSGSRYPPWGHSADGSRFDPRGDEQFIHWEVQFPVWLLPLVDQAPAMSHRFAFISMWCLIFSCI